MADRKTTTVLKTSVKRARVFVIRKLTRRIKMFRDKKGTAEQVQKNSRKVERLIQDVHELKDIDVNQFCEELLEKLGQSDINELYQEKERLKLRMVATSVLRAPLQSIQDKMADSHRHRMASSQAEGPDRLSAGQEAVQKQKAGQKSRSKRKPRDRQAQSTALQEEPRNRMGQRARRLLAEEKHGDEAKHLKRLQASGKAGSTQARGVKTGSTQAGGINGPSHPSWEAARKARLAESAAKFSGNRIVFD